MRSGTQLGGQKLGGTAHLGPRRSRKKILSRSRPHCQHVVGYMLREFGCDGIARLELGRTHKMSLTRSRPRRQQNHPEFYPNPPSRVRHHAHQGHAALYRTLH